MPALRSYRRDGGTTEGERLKGDVETAHGFAPRKRKEPPAEEGEASAQQWKLIIDCKDEAQQAELIEEFTGRGLTFTAPSM